jgi:hypothetical protein
MNTFDLEMLVDTVMDATESIIAETENVEECIKNDELMYILSFGDIRDSAEELQTLVLQDASIEQIENESINLYQNVKYIVEDLENEYSSIMTDEISSSFENIRTYVDAIRYTVNTFVSESKV